MKDRTIYHRHSARHNVRLLAVAAFLAALSIVCGKYLALSLGEVLRFSFENMPILLAGMMFGPVVGALVGTVADVLGCVIVGYVINPMVTVGAACIGLVGGLLFRLFAKLPLVWQCGLSVVVAHLIASVLVKTVGLAAYFPEMPFYVLLLWRLLNYCVVAAAEWLLLYTILKNQAVRRRLEALR